MEGVNNARGKFIMFPSAHINKVHRVVRGTIFIGFLLRYNMGYLFVLLGVVCWLVGWLVNLRVCWGCWQSCNQVIFVSKSSQVSSQNLASQVKSQVIFFPSQVKSFFSQVKSSLESIFCPQPTTVHVCSLWALWKDRSQITNSISDYIQ